MMCVFIAREVYISRRKTNVQLKEDIKDTKFPNGPLRYKTMMCM